MVCHSSSCQGLYVIDTVIYLCINAPWLCMQHISICAGLLLTGQSFTPTETLHFIRNSPPLLSTWDLDFSLHHMMNDRVFSLCCSSVWHVQVLRIKGEWQGEFLGCNYSEQSLLHASHFSLLIRFYGLVWAGMQPLTISSHLIGHLRGDFWVSNSS